MKTHAIAAAVALAASVPAGAITVNLTTTYFFDTDATISDAAGNLIPVGNRVVLGTFDTSGYASDANYFAAVGLDLDRLQGDFTGISGLLDTGAPGAYDGQFSDPGILDVAVAPWIESSSLGGRKVYMWAFETADNSANLGPHFSNVLSTGIFSSTDLDWTFLSSDEPPEDVMTLRTNTVDQFFVSTGNRLQLAALNVVPEPAAIGLLGCGGLVGVMAFRKRRRRL